MKDDLKDFPKCRAMVRAMCTNQQFKRGRSTLINAVTLQRETPWDTEYVHVIKKGPFSGIVFKQFGD